MSNRKSMNLSYESSTSMDFLKITQEKNRFIDILIEEQKKYSTDSPEYQSIKFAITAIAFSMELHIEHAKSLLNERQQKKMADIESLIQQDHKT